MTSTQQIFKSQATYPQQLGGLGPKALVAESKHLAGSVGGDASLGQWVEENRYVYDAIVSGSSDLSPMDREQFLQWWHWSLGQLEGSGTGWDPSASEGQAPTQSLPAGAIAGAQGNVVFDQKKATVEHVADQRPVDIYSNEVTINSGSMMTTFACELTTDTRLQPAEQVLKITASDGTVYFVHDYEDANITLKTPVEDMVANATGLDNVAWAEFTGNETDGNGAGWSGGETETIDDTHFVVTGAAGETIDVVPDKKVGEPVNVEFFGDVNVSLPADCSADVSGSGPLTVTVKDRNDQVIAVYTVHTERGDTVNVNGYVTVDGKEPATETDAEGKESLKGPENLSINGEACEYEAPIRGNIDVISAPIAAQTQNFQGLESIAQAAGTTVDAAFFQKLFQVYPNLVNYDKDFDGSLSPDEVNAMAKDGIVFPPAQPDKTFVQLLSALNPQLGVTLTTAKVLPQYAQAARDLLVDTLAKIYAQKAHVLPKESDPNAFYFNGQELKMADLA